jgi:chemotaxis protein MotB
MNKFPALILCLAATGCVSAGKYHDLEAQNQQDKQSLAAANAKVTELSGKLGIADTANTQLEGNVTQMQQALEELAKRRAETEKRLAEFRELTQKFSSLVNSGQLSVKVLNGKMTVVLSTDVLFPSGSARLSAKGVLAIQDVTQLLSTLAGRHYQIEGYTDNVPIKTKTFPSNWELASARAMTVLKTMLDAGMSPDRISAASYGDTQPVAVNETEDGRLQNRRISIVIVPDLSGLPGFDELNKMTKQPEAAPAPAPSPSPSPDAGH